ncbi:glutathione S-transferase [Tistlia consotensis]|uniref:Glutathione S-transferase n=1 Tax=Tistlia consotensis USBA 355 TaxID=560819 RepID=A0A1Y6C5R7_9PROT|nr:glutathione S-transferase family protein [Tistlia consotensis]SMF38627.1 glutathione S-transferase [Tistlia consotensis USBA 355]SNR36978.1 glutathione S-transferase [Tistlia consotensis]
MSIPVLHGAPYSVYVRIARLAFEEKGVAYELRPVDIFAAGGPPPGYERLQPFGRIPALEHGDFRLYETDAIVRYLDEAFPGPALSPEAPRERARMTQVMRILDNYGYPSLVWGVFVREAGSEADRDPVRLAAAIEPARRCLAVLEELLAGPFFLGERLSLADLHAAPMLTYLALAPTGRRLLEARPGLSAWLTRMAGRPSLAATRFPAEG